MKLFKTSGNFTISFGFDMISRKEDRNVICWNDPSSGGWDVKTTSQGSMPTGFPTTNFPRLPFEVAPEFVFESDGRIVAYQPGMCIELMFIGSPMVWAIRHLFPDQQITAKAA